ncbi:hypothetical protein PV04_02217 [Phialophora macrospora]|uniref:Uncharacterized protein n=1 Tax=Phialophora macrospora TaxID=1851006 RepID=A0A0D2FTQ5_9EURO|nr:hypothetical protein PV04_02217 [Phialophora macrospora]
MHGFGAIGSVFNAIWGYAATIVRKLIQTVDKVCSYVLDMLMAFFTVHAPEQDPLLPEGQSDSSSHSSRSTSTINLSGGTPTVVSPAHTPTPNVDSDQQDFQYMGGGL